jgi:hypothetical protein
MVVNGKDIIIYLIEITVLSHNERNQKNCNSTPAKKINNMNRVYCSFFFLILVSEAIGTAATPGLLCQLRVIIKMIVEKDMECRLAGETEVLGENLPQRVYCSLHHCIPQDTARPPAQDSRNRGAVYCTWRHKRETWRALQLGDAFGQILRIPPSWGVTCDSPAYVNITFKLPVTISPLSSLWWGRCEIFNPVKINSYTTPFLFRAGTICYTLLIIAGSGSDESIYLALHQSKLHLVNTISR